MKWVCHRFLPVDRYNQYQSNLIFWFLSIYHLISQYRFLLIDYSGFTCMAQSIPSVSTPFPGYLLSKCLLFCFVLCLEKLQMPHAGARRFIQKPYGGLKKCANAPPWENTKVAFSCKFSVFTWHHQNSN